MSDFISVNSYIRVRANLSDPWANAFRGGRDGLVRQVFDDGDIALFFGYDRNNRAQGCECVGPELWSIDELDFSTLELP